MSLEIQREGPRSRPSQSTLNNSGKPSSVSLLDLHRQSKTNLSLRPASSSFHAPELTDNKVIRGQWTRICKHTLYAAVPMAVIAGALLRHMKNRPISFTDASDMEDFTINGGTPLMLLLALLASLMALFLRNSVMSMAGFLISKLIIRHSADEDLAALPTPYEFSGLIQLLTDSAFGWLRGFKMLFSLVKNGCKRPPLLVAAAVSSLLAIVTAVIIASSIWLTISVVTVKGLDSVGPDALWSRQLADSCRYTSTSGGFDPNNFKTFPVPFNFKWCDQRYDLQSGGELAAQTANGRSSSHIVGDMRLKDGSQMSVLLDVSAVGYGTPFMASSFGVNSTCRPITHECDVEPTRLSYNCPDHSFTGMVTRSVSVVVSGFTPDAQNVTGTFHWLATGSLGGGGGDLKKFNGDEGVILRKSNSRLFVILSCSSEAYRVDYYRAYGANYPINMKQADNRTSSIILNPMFPDLRPGYSGFGRDFLEAGMREAARSARSSQELADAFGLAFSKIAIASVSPFMDPVQSSPNGLNAKTILRVPRVPYLMLVVGVMSYVVLALTFGVSAGLLFYFDKNVGNVSSRLSVTGLAAKAFEPAVHGNKARRMKDLFANEKDLGRRRRVKAKKTELEGWTWET